MSKVHTKLINGLEEAIINLFAPAIHEDQSFTCYVGEEISPFVIQCDNVPSSSSGGDT